jgi:hypothetical protein
VTGPQRPRGVTAALRALYPSADILTRTSPAGLVVSLPARCARYLGIGHDNARAAAWLSWHMKTPVTVAPAAPSAGIAAWVEFTVVPDPGGPLPPDPGGSQGVPVYATVDGVLGPFPATRPVRQLIKTALDAGLRPHLDLAPSTHGPRYRVQLWGTDPTTLAGCIDVSEETGRFAEAWLMWRQEGASPGRYGWADEKHYAKAQAAEVRRQLENARDLHRVTRRGVTR